MNGRRNREKNKLLSTEQQLRLLQQDSSSRAPIEAIPSLLRLPDAEQQQQRQEEMNSSLRNFDAFYLTLPSSYRFRQLHVIVQPGFDLGPCVGMVVNALKSYSKSVNLFVIRIHGYVRKVKVVEKWMKLWLRSRNEALQRVLKHWVRIDGGQKSSLRVQIYKDCRGVQERMKYNLNAYIKLNSSEEKKARAVVALYRKKRDKFRRKFYDWYTSYQECMREGSFTNDTMAFVQAYGNPSDFLKRMDDLLRRKPKFCFSADLINIEELRSILRQAQSSSLVSLVSSSASYNHNTSGTISSIPKLGVATTPVPSSLLPLTVTFELSNLNVTSSSSNDKNRRFHSPTPRFERNQSHTDSQMSLSTSIERSMATEEVTNLESNVRAIPNEPSSPLRRPMSFELSTLSDSYRIRRSPLCSPRLELHKCESVSAISTSPANRKRSSPLDRTVSYEVSKIPGSSRDIHSPVSSPGLPQNKCNSVFLTPSGTHSAPNSSTPSPERNSPLQRTHSFELSKHSDSIPSFSTISRKYHIQPLRLNSVSRRQVLARALASPVKSARDSPVGHTPRQGLCSSRGESQTSRSFSPKLSSRANLPTISSVSIAPVSEGDGIGIARGAPCAHPPLPPMNSSDVCVTEVWPVRSNFKEVGELLQPSGTILGNMLCLTLTEGSNSVEDENLCNIPGLKKVSFAPSTRLCLREIANSRKKDFFLI